MKEINVSNASEMITEELFGEDTEVRQWYTDNFKSQITDFTNAMSKAYINWKQFDDNIGKDKKKAYVSALIYSAINSHIVSVKIFLSGYIVPAGNLQRQVLETIALALLCSNPQLKVLDRFMKNKYPTNKAVKDVLNNYQKLNLKKTAIQTLERYQVFHHKYSHPTQLSLASLVSFSKEGKLYLGAAYDEGKTKDYTKEINSRLGLAKIFNNIIDGIRANVEQWK